MACLAVDNAWCHRFEASIPEARSDLSSRIAFPASRQRRFLKCRSRPRRSQWLLKASGSDDKSNSTPSGTKTADKEEEKASDSQEKQEEQPQEIKQEMDWKQDEDFKKFMGNPSIEAALKLEKKRAEQRLKELNNEQGGNVFTGLIQNISRSIVQREKDRLEQVEQKFKALDLGKLKSCFGYDTFYATDVRRFGDGGIYIGNLRKPIDEVIPVLKERLANAAGREVTIWFMEEEDREGNDIKKQVCVVQPKEEIDLQYELSSLNNVAGYISALLLGVTTLGTISLTSGFFLTPNATFDDYIARVLPLFGGFITILGVSEAATRLTANKYGVRLSPSFLIPSTWTGCLGVVNNYESILPSKKALFDIAAARITSAYVTSFLLAAIAFYLDQSLNGGDNALYIRPQFFFNNPLLSFIQYVTGPYTDELGNVLPQAVPGLGVPVDPLAFAGLLGIVVTSMNLLPCGRLEGGRIAQALYGRRVANILSFFTSLALGVGGVTGSVLSLTWGFVATFFRGGEELPAEDEITPLGTSRYIWGYALAVFCLLTLFPNSAGTFPSVLYTPPFFRGDGGF
ncbi:probable zinc metallopeptidase EGY3, chloroplastic isoform X2 [Selaginella moellendorffii]|uniref:probable zinc metallopeptidase EGY3, chloroplastic isoform X2 n=1 Tax=Selaginella moellendorffii TaxID=88036 RepID=UPI000D1C46BC|nr:probable zinc metallopeptidase EGY3, chloroplastic isoform X2 [Selaginella moellendorffii]|eukprot:XP_024542775.1 probable zinc metallopeptidase EGY3, chloroplastic isoform X2 [Selaginella moellendorffii]